MVKLRIFDGVEEYEAEAEDSSKRPYIAVKKCRIMRSGVQLYARDEVPQELLASLPADKAGKKVLKVYRRPEAVVKHLKDYNYLPLVNGHPDEDVTPDNHKKLEIGHIGGVAELKVLDDGNVYVENDVVMDDRAAWAEYKNGKKELSIGLEAVWVVSDSPDWDLEVVDFTNVNHVALVPRGRAGSLARITDSMAAVSRDIGGDNMNGFLRMLGIGKKDGAADFKLSAAVMQCADKLASGLAQDAAEAEVSKVMENVARLGDSEDRRVLVGMVRDALSGAADLSAADEEAKKKVADAIDSVYQKCLDADEEKVKSVVADVLGKKDEGKKDGEDDGEGKNGGEDGKSEGKQDDGCGKQKDGCGAQKDTAEAVQAAIAKALVDALPGAVDAAVAKALGTDGQGGRAKGPQADSAPDFSDADLMQDAWNM